MLGSAIVYRGPSWLYRPAPIVAIVTGLERPSANRKTGRHMAQLWILRSDISPLEAIYNRGDYAICGDCSLRGNDTKSRSCYVAVSNAPTQIYQSFHAGRYTDVDPGVVKDTLKSKNMSIRLGAYGEPTALPLWVLRDLTEGIPHTGYTHQWRDRPAYRDLLMASVDTAESAVIAKSQGWRTFRSRLASEPLQASEIACPASAESGYRTTCDACLLCDGRNANDQRTNITIIAHGSGKVHFMEFRR